MTHLATILWRSRAEENTDCCSLSYTADGFHLRGVTLLAANGLPARIQYRVDCSLAWRTRRVELSAWLAGYEKTMTLFVDADGRWWRDGVELYDFRGLVDVDLSFTPSTNTLPIRRLNLDIGHSAVTTAVWVQFPSLEIAPFPQRYTHLAGSGYRFESLDGSFTARLAVDEFGLVTDYESLWVQTARSG
ncbi:MAG: putative glycolipid-binding domain-containing protein [Chloroflexi bacterium]|nr:putative glycolipid-binding domain-containing protein [Chloroflexota bacterium]